MSRLCAMKAIEGGRGGSADQIGESVQGCECECERECECALPISVMCVRDIGRRNGITAPRPAAATSNIVPLLRDGSELDEKANPYRARVRIPVLRYRATPRRRVAAEAEATGAGSALPVQRSSSTHRGSVPPLTSHRARRPPLPKRSPVLDNRRMIHRYGQFESLLDNMWPYLLSEAPKWLRLTSSSWRATPWREVCELLRRAGRLPATFTCQLRDLLVGKCLAVLARTSRISTRQLSRLRAAAVGGTNPTTATFCKVLFAAGFAMPLSRAPGEEIEIGLPSGNPKRAFRVDVKAAKSHHTENCRGRPRQGFLRNVLHPRFNCPGLRNWSQGHLMSSPDETMAEAMAPPVSSPDETMAETMAPPVSSLGDTMAAPMGASSGASRAEVIGQEGGRKGTARLRRLVLLTRALRKNCSEEQVHAIEQGKNSPSFSHLDPATFRYDSTDPTDPTIGGVEGVGVMATKFDDLNSEVREVPPIREPDNPGELLVRGMAEAHKSQAESLAKMTELQMQMAANNQAAQLRQEQALLKQEEALLKQEAAVNEAATFQLSLTKELSEQIDNRFDKLAKAQPMPLQGLAIQRLLELTGTAVGLWKRSLEEKSK